LNVPRGEYSKRGDFTIKKEIRAKKSRSDSALTISAQAATRNDHACVQIVISEL
jgi:hypothetical protein